MRQQVRTRATKNPTTRTGRVVHGDGGRQGYPACGSYVRGIWYTDETVNCPRCIEKLCNCGSDWPGADPGHMPDCAAGAA